MSNRDNIVSFPRPTRDERTQPRPGDSPTLRQFKTLAASIKAQAEEDRDDWAAQRRLAEQSMARD